LYEKLIKIEKFDLNKKIRFFDFYLKNHDLYQPCKNFWKLTCRPTLHMYMINKLL